MISAEELGDLQKDFEEVLENAPAAVVSSSAKGDGNMSTTTSTTSAAAPTDKYGRPCRFPEHYLFGLGSGQTPAGGLSKAKWSTASGQTKASAGEEAGERTMHVLYHPLMVMESALRVYAHPDLLRVVESINGPDFLPFVEALYHKAAGEGVPTAWHQDGRTHWREEDGAALEDENGNGWTHGFTFHVAMSKITAENSLWVLPGSHRRWCLANGGEFPPLEERVPGAVPMMMRPGDVSMHNRSLLHGAFTNRSPEPRVNLDFGFHKRSAVLWGGVTRNVHACQRLGDSVKMITYDEAYVNQRSRVIQVAIDARRQRFPQEVPYVYKPLAAEADQSRWNEKAKEEVLKDYWAYNITL